MTSLDRDYFRPAILGDPDRPNVARTYDYLLGGSLNFEPDRVHAAQTERMMPGAAECVRSNRSFTAEGVRVVAAQGVRQFLDLGAGLPTAGGLHTLVESDPQARWVAVDNEVVAVECGKEATKRQPYVRYVLADLAQPARVLQHPEVRELIDFSKPVAILLSAALHLIPDRQDPWGLVAQYRDATVRGSYLILTHGTTEDPLVPQMTSMPSHYASTSSTYVPRGYNEIVRFTEGYEVLEPGVTFTGQWRLGRLYDAARAPKSGAYGFIGKRV